MRTPTEKAIELLYSRIRVVTGSLDDLASEVEQMILDAYDAGAVAGRKEQAEEGK